MKKSINIPELLAVCLTVLTICIGAYISINNKVSALEVKQNNQETAIQRIDQTTTSIYNLLINQKK